MAGRKRRRRGLSVGSILLLAMMAATLSMIAWLLPKFVGDMQEFSTDSARLLGTLTESVDMPGALRGVPAAVETAPAQQDALPVPEQASAAAPAVATAPPTRMVSIMAGGSVLIPKNIRQSGYDADSKTYNFDSIFGEVQSLFSGSDFALCTVESAFAGAEAGYGDYNAPDAMLDALQYAGIDLISLGNERALDRGIDGLRTTVQTMESKGFIIAGVADGPERSGDVRVFHVNDVQIAVLAYSYGISGEGQKATKKADRYPTALLEPELIRADIANARKAGADIVIVMPHWGARNSLKVEPAQKKLAEQLVGMGADLVLGAHPNVVQRVDRVRATGPDGKEREAIVAYSLGALLSDGRSNENASGMLMHFDVQVDLSTHTARVVRYGYVPTWVQRARVASGKYDYAILRADDEETIAAADSSTQNRLQDAQRVVQRALGEPVEVPVYWP